MTAVTSAASNISKTISLAIINSILRFLLLLMLMLTTANSTLATVRLKKFYLPIFWQEIYTFRTDVSH